MNTNNDWKNQLKLANEDLENSGYSILITEPEEGFFFCEFWKDGEFLETYAGNYYEDELEDLITDAWSAIKMRLP